MRVDKKKAKNDIGQLNSLEAAAPPFSSQTFFKTKSCNVHCPLKKTKSIDIAVKKNHLIPTYHHQ